MVVRDRLYKLYRLKETIAIASLTEMPRIKKIKIEYLISEVC